MTDKILLALFACTILFVSGMLLGAVLQGDAATIGGTSVPHLECQEDEVISWVGIDTLDCVHFEDVAKERR